MHQQTTNIGLSGLPIQKEEMIQLNVRRCQVRSCHHGRSFVCQILFLVQ